MKVYEMLNSDDKEMRKLGETSVFGFDQTQLTEFIDFYLSKGSFGKLPKRIKRYVAKEIYRRTSLAQ